MRDIFEETYGFFLTRDVFADKKRSLLKLNGFPNAAAKADSAIYVDTKWSQIDNVIKWLKSAKVVAMIIVPDWKHHTWFKFLEEKASHRMLLPLGTGLWVDKEGKEVPHLPFTRFYCYFYDSRYEDRATNRITKITLPPLDKMLTAAPPPPRQVIPLQKSDFLKLRPKQHISVQWFMKWGPKCLQPKLFRETLSGLIRGFPTRYRGGGELVRNYANKMKPEEEKKATEKARETVERGWGAGPFLAPPLTNQGMPETSDSHQELHHPETQMD